MDFDIECGQIPLGQYINNNTAKLCQNFMVSY